MCVTVQRTIWRIMEVDNSWSSSSLGLASSYRELRWASHTWLRCKGVVSMVLEKATRAKESVQVFFVRKKGDIKLLPQLYPVETLDCFCRWCGRYALEWSRIERSPSKSTTTDDAVVLNMTTQSLQVCCGSIISSIYFTIIIDSGVSASLVYNITLLRDLPQGRRVHISGIGGQELS